MQKKASQSSRQVEILAESALALAERGERDDAATIYEQILKIAPYHVRALRFLAAMALEQNNPKKSIALLEKALRAAPDRAILHQNLGLSYHTMGDNKRALLCLDKALELNPEMSITWLYKGAILEQENQADEAVRAYVRLWNISPEINLQASTSAIADTVKNLIAHSSNYIVQKRTELIDTLLAPAEKKYGADSMDRVRQSAEIYLGRQQPQYVHALQRPDFLYFPDSEPRAFYEPEEFPFLAPLEKATSSLRNELETLLGTRDGLEPYVEVPAGYEPRQWSELAGSQKWSCFRFYHGGQKIENNCNACPETAKVLEQLPLPYINHHSPEAIFSILEPGTHIPPHFGLGNYKLAVHLPLIVPSDCSIRVGNETRGWQEGKCLIFDDSFQHEAWNNSDTLRAVLITEIWNPCLSAAEREGITALVAAHSEFNLRFGQSHPAPNA